MSTISAPVRIKVSTRSNTVVPYTVELGDTTAVARYRSEPWPDEVADVLRIEHQAGVIISASWDAQWFLYWSPQVRDELIRQVQLLLTCLVSGE